MSIEERKESIAQYRRRTQGQARPVPYVITEARIDHVFAGPTREKCPTVHIEFVGMNGRGDIEIWWDNRQLFIKSDNPDPDHFAAVMAQLVRDAVWVTDADLGRDYDREEHEWGEQEARRQEAKKESGKKPPKPKAKKQSETKAE